VPAATFPSMIIDQHAGAGTAFPGVHGTGLALLTSGQAPAAAVAGELLGRVRAGLPAVAALGQREQMLAAAWLTSLRSPRTQRAYCGDLQG
jgi:hypothetical protein